MVIARIAAAAFVVVLSMSAAARGQQAPTGPAASPAVDPTSSLVSRVGDTDPSVLKLFVDGGMPVPTRHVLTEAERQSLTRAFAALPPVHQHVLRERLRRLSFVDGMPNTALTSTVDPAAPVRLYDLTIRAGVLRETVSEFLTQKERTCFDLTGSTRTVDVEGGSLEAIVYVLLHEATHMVDNALELTPAEDGPPTAKAYLLTAGVWVDRLTVAPAYASPVLQRLVYRRGGRPIPMSEAETTYGALRRTPFVSLYGSSNWHDDLAELLAWHHLTSRMGQPYRIVVRDSGRDVVVYEPMASPLVQSRINLLTRFYGDPPVSDRRPPA